MSVKKTIPQRAVIHSRDVENITGRKGRTAQRLLQKIRDYFGKQKFQFITVAEFCEFTGIDESIVKAYLLD